MTFPRAWGTAMSHPTHERDTPATTYPQPICTAAWPNSKPRTSSLTAALDTTPAPPAKKRWRSLLAAVLIVLWPAY